MNFLNFLTSWAIILAPHAHFLQHAWPLREATMSFSRGKYLHFCLHKYDEKDFCQNKSNVRKNRREISISSHILAECILCAYSEISLLKLMFFFSIVWKVRRRFCLISILLYTTYYRVTARKNPGNSKIKSTNKIPLNYQWM